MLSQAQQRSAVGGDYQAVHTEEAAAVTPTKPAAASAERPLMRVLLVLAACLAWLLASSGIIIANRGLMVELGFGFPMAVAAMGMGVSGLFGFIVCDLLRMVPPNSDKVDWNFIATKVLPIGAAQAVAMWLSNASYLYLTVAFIEMARSLLPLFTMGALYFAALETPTAHMVKSVLVTAVGCAISAYGEVKLSFVGLTYLGANFVTESARLVMSQSILQGFELHPMQALKLVTPAAVACLGTMSLAMERKGMIEKDAGKIVADNWPYFAVAASLGLVVNLLSNVIIKLSSATTVKVLAAVRGPLVVVAGVLLFSEVVTAIELFGYVVTLAGFVWYNVAKAQQVMAAPAEKPVKR